MRIEKAMSDGTIPILKIGPTLLATIQVDLYDSVVDAFQNDVLEEIEKTSATGLIIDISGLESVDSYVARMLASTGKMTKLMGVETVIVGMRPAVAATLVRMGYFMPGIRTALSLQEGLEIQASRLKELADE
jgi:rsbT antagonist protein RsbS